MARIAFLGTGTMGRAMAARLIAAGHDLRVHNRTMAKAEPLRALGAELSPSPRAAVQGADAIIAMVGDDAASRAVWMGADGALAADLPEGALAIECSTLSHDWVLELAKTVRERGLRYLDCPVTGVPDMAQSGDLTLLIGAEKEDLDIARPLIAPLCRDVIHFGPIGTGTAYKLMVNLMGSVQIAAVAEGMLVAEKAGLDAAVVADALSRGAAASPQVIRNAGRMAAGGHDQNVTFSSRWRLKDTLYGLRLAEKLGQDTPLGRAAAAAFQALTDQGHGADNESKLIDVLRS